MKYRILNFAVIEKSDLHVIEQFGDIVHAGIALGEKKNPSEETVKELLKKHQPEILILNSLPFGKSCIDAAESVKLIVCARGNPLNVDADYCREKEIILTCTPGRNANAVAEYTILVILALFRKLIPANQAIETRECTLDMDPSEINPNAKDIVWMHPQLSYFPYNQFNGREIKGCSLGLIGFGHVGQLVAEKAKVLGMTILVYDPFISKEVLAKFDAVSLPLEELLKKSDVVSLHAKATKDTFEMINKNTLALMKHDAILINTARSTLINVESLLESLKTNKLLGAALDVFDYEPLSSKDIVLKEPIPNLLLTPHIGGATKEVPLHQSRMIRESIESFATKKDIPYRVK